jgi:hypothetical protein
MQQAVYNKATGDEPGLLFVTPAGYNIVTAENCDALKPEALEATYQDVVKAGGSRSHLPRRSAALGGATELAQSCEPELGKPVWPSPAGLWSNRGPTWP